MFTKLLAVTKSEVKSPGGERPPWKAKTVWVALGLMLLGGGLWIKDRAQPDSPSAAAPVASSQFSDPATTGAPSGRRHEMRPSASAIFRIGASYVGGFFLGWTFRRFLKLTLLLAGAAIVLIILGKKFGWFELDWATAQGHARHSLAWLQGEAGAFKEFVTGYLPSAGAAEVGAFLGFLRK